MRGTTPAPSRRGRSSRLGATPTRSRPSGERSPTPRPVWWWRRASCKAARVLADGEARAQELRDAARSEREQHPGRAPAVERARLIDEAHAEAARIRAASLNEVTTFARRLDTERREIVELARVEAAKIVADAQAEVDARAAAEAEAAALALLPEPPMVSWRPPDAPATNGDAPSMNGDARSRRVHRRATKAQAPVVQSRALKRRSPRSST